VKKSGSDGPDMGFTELIWAVEGLGQSFGQKFKTLVAFWHAPPLKCSGGYRP